MDSSESLKAATNDAYRIICRVCPAVIYFFILPKFVFKVHPVPAVAGYALTIRFWNYFKYFKFIFNLFE